MASILKECEREYNKGRGGNVQGVLNLASKKNFTHLEYCGGCEAEMPVAGSPSKGFACLVCGGTCK